MVSFNVKINENVHEIKDVDGNLFIGEVKSMVENVSGVPKNCQKWIYKGRILTDQMSLVESNIVEGNTVIVMRTAPASPTPTANGSSSEGGKSVPSIGHSATINQEAVRPSQSTAHFDNAMFELLQSSDESAVLACVTTLLKVISNIVAFPLEDKYRRLNRTNAAFAKKVGSLSGGSSCMIALGFQLVGDDWILVPNATAWDNITSCKLKLEKFSQKLGDKIAREKGSQPIAAPAPSSQGSSTPSPLDPHAMQQFLQSLAAIQTNLPLNLQASNSSESATNQQGTQGDVSNIDGKEEDEETIPQL